MGETQLGKEHLKMNFYCSVPAIGLQKIELIKFLFK